VRDLYAVGDDLLLVATDRILHLTMCWNGHSGKGKILTQISLFWFDLCGGCSQPPDDGRREAISIRARALCRSVEGPLDAGEASKHVSRGMCERAATWRDRDGRNTSKWNRLDIPLPAGLLDRSQLPDLVYSADQEPRMARTTRTSVLRHRSPVGWSDAKELRRRRWTLYTKAAKHASRAG